MKVILRVLVAVFALALFPVVALAQSPQQDTITGSGIQIQNLSGETANIVLRFVSSENNVPDVTQQETVPANASRTFVSFSEGDDGFDVGSGFDGSVVVESDQPVVAIVNVLGANFTINESYPGFNAGATTVNVPLVVRNNVVGPNAETDRASTSISVQNASDSDVTATITYTPSGAGNAGTEPQFTLGAGQSRTFSQFAKTELGDLFVGSAVVEASGPVAVAVVQEGFDQLFSYAAFPAGAESTTVALPLVVANNTGNRSYTGLTVQNAGSNPTDITYTFATNQATEVDPVVGVDPCGTNGQMEARTFSDIAAGASVNLLTQAFAADTTPGDAGGFDGQFFECLYVGGATVTASEPLVATVNQVQLQNAKSASTYEGFNPASASGDTRAPLALANNSGYITGVQVQNVGENAADVTISYSPNTYTQTGDGLPACDASTPRTASGVAAGASFTFLQAPFGDIPAGDPQFDGCTYVGSATITSDGSVVAVVNQINIGFLAAADALLTYNAFNQ